MAQTSVATSLTVAIKGQLVDGTDYVSRSYVNGHASSEIPFGVVVGVGTADNEVIPLAAITDEMRGVVIHRHSYNKTVELGTTGVKPDMVVEVLRKGVIWMQTETAVVPEASVVYVRAIAGGSEVAGDVRDDTDASDLIDCSKFARFLTTAAIGGLVQVEWDFTNQAA